MDDPQNALDALAVAYAEAGDFANAVKWENQYIEAPHLTAIDSTNAKGRLKLFQHQKAYHEEK